jgi:hypothetical protein
MGEVTQHLLRFAIGGTLVAVFASVGDVLRPKGFAGLFGAAPSIALAGLALAVHMHGSTYGALEARSMIIGAVAFVLYATLCVYLMGVRHFRASLAATAALLVWGVAAAVGFMVLTGLTS